MDKTEIDEQLIHQRKMMRVLRQRLQQRELQEAQFGINVPPEVKSEIVELAERLQEHETKIAQLQTLAAEDQLPLAEVEYRALLAEAWDTPKGRPTVVGAARLELSRLRLGIPTQRTQELEHEIRVALALETISNFDPRSLYALTNLTFDRMAYKTSAPDVMNTEAEALRILGRAILLDYEITIKWLSSRATKPEDIASLRRALYTVNGIWGGSEESILIKQFAKDYQAALETRKSEYKDTS